MPRATDPNPPSLDDLLLAAEWLEANEGDGGESTSCQKVADWLRAYANRREDSRIMKQVAKEQGVSVALVRTAVARIPPEHLALSNGRSVWKNPNKG